jgi:hypothetical protein
LARSSVRDQPCLMVLDMSMSPDVVTNCHATSAADVVPPDAAEAAEATDVTEAAEAAEATDATDAGTSMATAPRTVPVQRTACTTPDLMLKGCARAPPHGSTTQDCRHNSRPNHPEAPDLTQGPPPQTAQPPVDAKVGLYIAIKEIRRFPWNPADLPSIPRPGIARPDSSVDMDFTRSLMQDFRS